MNRVGLRVLFLSFALFASPVGAAPTPPAAAPKPSQPDALISLKIDFHNLVRPTGEGRLDPSAFRDLLDGVNGLWDQCSIRFSLRNARNVAASELGVRYRPTEMKHLYEIAGAIAPPDGGGALPVTLAGRWKIPEGNGNYLNGLGWAFVNASGLDRFGAMINASRLGDEAGVPIVAHEIAHALSLQHVSGAENLMGGGGPNLTAAQCAQARRFSSRYLAGFTVAAR